MYFYIQACKNGHFKADYKRIKEGQVCEICGEPLMETCPSCGAVIQRWTYYGSVPICYKASSYELQDNCPKCGEAYPWKENK